ncbi:protein of unknown function [Burkholderia multivorans]
MRATTRLQQGKPLIILGIPQVQPFMGLGCTFLLCAVRFAHLFSSLAGIGRRKKESWQAPP